MRLVKCKEELINAEDTVRLLRLIRMDAQDIAIIHPVRVIVGDELYIDMDSNILETSIINVHSYAAGMIESQQKEIWELKQKIKDLGGTDESEK